MIVYFDNCAIQRPLDNRLNVRNRVEAEAMISLIELVEDSILTVASSDVLLYELNNTPDPDRIAFGMKFLKLSKVFLNLTDKVVIEAKSLKNLELSPLTHCILPLHPFIKLITFAPVTTVF